MDDELGFGRWTNGDEEREARNRVLQEFMCCISLLCLLQSLRFRERAR